MVNLPDSLTMLTMSRKNAGLLQPGHKVEQGGGSLEINPHDMYNPFAILEDGFGRQFKSGRNG